MEEAFVLVPLHREVMGPDLLAVAVVVVTPRDLSLMLPSIILEVLLLISSNSIMLSAVVALLHMLLLHLPLMLLLPAAVLPTVVLPQQSTAVPHPRESHPPQLRFMHQSPFGVKTTDWRTL